MDKPIARVYAHEGTTELVLAEDITRATAERLLQQLSVFKGQPIVLSIFSQGGDAMASFAIHDYIRDEKNGMDVEVRVYGIAASGAMIVAAAGRKALIGQGSFANIHNAFAVGGDATEDEKRTIEAMNERQVAIFSARTGKNKGSITKLMNEDRLLSADEAVEVGLFDATIAEAKVAAMLKGTTMQEGTKIKISTKAAFAAMMDGAVTLTEEQVKEVRAQEQTTLQAKVEQMEKELAEAKAALEAGTTKEAEGEKAIAEARKEVDGLKAQIKTMQDEALKGAVKPSGGAVQDPVAQNEDPTKNMTRREREAASGMKAYREAVEQYLKPRAQA